MQDGLSNAQDREIAARNSEHAFGQRRRFSICRTPSFRELKSRIEKPGEAESWGPIRRRARRSGGRAKFDWQHPFSSAVRWIAPDNSDSASLAASEDFGGSVQDHPDCPEPPFESPLGNCSLSTCSSLPASEDAYGLPDCPEPDRGPSAGSAGAFPAISEGAAGGCRPDGECCRSNGLGRVGCPPLPGHSSATVSPERNGLASNWQSVLPSSRSEGLLSEWTRGSFGSAPHSGKLFGLEASYSSEDLLAAFQTELDRSPRKLAKASQDSSESGGQLSRPSARCAVYHHCTMLYCRAEHALPSGL